MIKSIIKGQASLVRTPNLNRTKIFVFLVKKNINKKIFMIIYLLLIKKCNLKMIKAIKLLVIIIVLILN